jgi:bacterioferritin-associated ferredoxin
MGAGGADALYKKTGMVPEGPVALAGSGPLIYAVAVHLGKLGVKISHFLDTTPQLGPVKALDLLPRALGRAGYLFQGLGMLARTWKSAGTVKRGVTRYAAHGGGRLEKISFRCHGRTHEFETQSLIVHEGIIPRWDFARQLHLTHLWEPVQRYWYPRLDPFGRTSEHRIYIAGDGGFVHGAVAAEKKGRLAALDIATDLGHISLHEKEFAIKTVMGALNREIGPRPFIDKAFSPRSGLYGMDDDTLVCRCEEVTAEKIRTAILQGMVLPEAVKGLTRCGMGPCQSRICGPGFMELMAKETGQAPDALSPLNIRPPVRNLNSTELAEMTLLNTSLGG